MANLKSTIRKYLLAGVAKEAGVILIESQLVEARGGMYSCGVQAAIAAKGNKADFIEVVDTLMSDFRANRRDIAVKHEMEQQSDNQGKPKVDSDNNPVYKVPRSLSVVKSVLAKGFDNGIGMGSITKPESFSSIRDAAAVAAVEKAEANATPDDKLRASIQKHLDTIGSLLLGGGLDSKSLKVLNTLLAATVKSNTPKKAAKLNLDGSKKKAA